LPPADTWLRHGWITATQASTIRLGGYYTTLVRPGFRIIALNNNDQYIYNWWIMYSRTDIQGQLQWLHNTLLTSEQANERVHILAHIRSGSGSSLRFWSREYRRIIDRFHMIIGAQFNGHSHRVDHEVFYDSATATHAINLAWNAGSVAAFVGVNPNYIQYFIDRTHYVRKQVKTAFT
jgi:sphingomyelin phosphodiesterase